MNSQTKPYLFSQYKEHVEKIINETRPYANAEVYWFNDKEFITDIANYKDLGHYSAKYNSMFLEHFSSGKSIINTSNYKLLLNDFERKANEVDLVTLAGKFM